MAWDSVHVFECPTRVHYGFGAAAQAGERAAELGITRAALVSDAGVEAAGTVERIAGRLRAAGIEPVVYARTEANPAPRRTRPRRTSRRSRRSSASAAATASWGSAAAARWTPPRRPRR
jgi:alcohol dehydrogenase class IV